MIREIMDLLEENPVIAAVRKGDFEKALDSPSKVIFLLNCNILTVSDMLERAHSAGKAVFVHIDLAEGIGKDKYGLKYLLTAGADGVISTKASIIKMAREMGLLTVQRFFVYDSQGVGSIDEMLTSSCPHIIEIMPGVIRKITERFAKIGIPLIAGGLIENKKEITEALSSGALAVSTGREELWYE